MLLLFAEPVLRRVLLYACATLALVAGILWFSLTVVCKERDAAIADRTALTAKLELQNAAVKQWQKEAVAQAALTAAAVAEAGKVKVITRERVERILEAPVPSTCPEAVLWGTVEGTKQAAEWRTP